jgi:hypothetical protein
MGRTEYYANRGALITGSALTFRLTRSDMAQPSLGTLSVVKFRELIRLLEEDEWCVASIGPVPAARYRTLRTSFGTS